jgi:flagellar M-ring protein FliF
MVLWFGVRPGLKMALAPPRVAATEVTLGDFGGQMPPLAAPDGEGQPQQNYLIASEPNDDEFLQALLARRDNGPGRKLQKLVDFDESRAATILKQWIRQGANG